MRTRKAGWTVGGCADLGGSEPLLREGARETASGVGAAPEHGGDVGELVKVECGVECGVSRAAPDFHMRQGGAWGTVWGTLT